MTGSVPAERRRSSPYWSSLQPRASMGVEIDIFPLVEVCRIDGIGVNLPPGARLNLYAAKVLFGVAQGGRNVKLNRVHPRLVRRTHDLVVHYQPHRPFSSPHARQLLVSCDSASSRSVLWRHATRPVAKPTFMVRDRGTPDTVVEIHVVDRVWKPTERAGASTAAFVACVCRWVVQNSCKGCLDLRAKLAAKSRTLLFVICQSFAQLFDSCGVENNRFHGYCSRSSAKSSCAGLPTAWPERIRATRRAISAFQAAVTPSSSGSSEVRRKCASSARSDAGNELSWDFNVSSAMTLVRSLPVGSFSRNG